MDSEAPSLDSLVASHVSDLKELVRLSDQVFILFDSKRNELTSDFDSLTVISDEEINNLRNNLNTLKSVSIEFFTLDENIQKKKTRLHRSVLIEYYTAFLKSDRKRKKTKIYRIFNEYITSNSIEDMDWFIEAIQSISNTFSSLIVIAKHVFEACKIFILLSKNWSGFQNAIYVKEYIFSIQKCISSIHNAFDLFNNHGITFTSDTDIFAKFDCFEDIFSRIALKYEKLSSSLVKKDFERLAARVVDDFLFTCNCVSKFSKIYESIILSGTLLDSTELQNIASYLIEYAEKIQVLSGFVADITTCIDPNEPEGKMFNEYLYVASNANLEDGLITELTQTILRPSKALYASDTRLLKARSYFSIVGPSYIGKTQFAFMLAHTWPVFYVNFFSYHEFGQFVCRPFSSCSRVFKSILEDDIENLEKQSNSPEQCLDSSSLITNLGFKFKTIGFIWSLIEHSLLFDFTDSSKNWFSHYLERRTILFDSMSFKDFMFRFNALDPGAKRNFKAPILFIDEYSIDFAKNVKLLRNFGRILGLPVILASSNADVNELPNFTDHTFTMRIDPVVWVNVIRALPKANLKSVLHIAGFEPYLIDADNSIDVERVLVDHCVDFGNVNELSLFKKLIALILEQSKTCLPGISVLVFKILKVKLTSIGKSGSEAGRLLNTNNIFKSIIIRLNELLSSGKPNAFNYDPETFNFGPYFSLSLLFKQHYSLSLLFQQDQEFLSREMMDRLMAASINKHFYYFGNVSDPVIVPLIICPYGIKFRRNNLPYPIRSHFSHFRDDIFLYMSLFHNVTKQPISISSILSQFCVKINVANQNIYGKINDFRPQELMVLWSLSNASHHLSVTEPAIIGNPTENVIIYEKLKNEPFLFKDFLSRFVANLQSDDLGMFIFYSKALLAYMSRIELPYLLPAGNANPCVSEALSEFCRFGQCGRLANRDHFDIGFQMYFDGVLRTGSVECKYQGDPITAKEVCEYIARPMDNFEKLNGADPADPVYSADSVDSADPVDSADSVDAEDQGLPSPFSLMVSDSLHESIKCSEKWAEAVNEFKSKRPKLDFNSSISDVSVYSIFFNAQSILEIVPLVEAHEPRSVFVIVQTNFEIPKS